MKFFSNLIFIIILLNYSCNNIKSSTESKEKKGVDSFNFYDSEVDRCKKFYPNELIDFIPFVQDENYITFSTDLPRDTIERMQQSYSFFLVKKYNEKLSDSLLLELKDAKCYNANESNYLLVFSYIQNEDNVPVINGKNIEDSKNISISNVQKSNQFPVPNFSCLFPNETNTLTLCGLNLSYRIFITNSKSGIYINPKLLRENKYIPNNWKHGFSKGYAISETEKKIIYWVVAW